VESKTQQKIKELIPQGVLTVLTRLVLANAIYFKGDWAVQFDGKATAKAPFHVAPGETVEAPLMSQKNQFGYAELGELQVLALNYKGKALSMVVLLPKKPDGLAALETSLTPANLEKWTRNLPAREVQVFLPKFKMTSQFRLNEKLRALGMTDAFDESKADFSGLDGRKQYLFITAVLHKAFVEVNEEGTEAAAATAVVIGLRSAPARPLVFRADHPFLFLIRDNRTGSILFLGRVVDPAK
jgi:serpin B